MKLFPLFQQCEVVDCLVIKLWFEARLGSHSNPKIMHQHFAVYALNVYIRHAQCMHSVYTLNIYSSNVIGICTDFLSTKFLIKMVKHPYDVGIASRGLYEEVKSMVRKIHYIISKQGIACHPM